MNEKDKLCLDLFKIGAVKFGDFTLKSGLKSPIYIDLRVLISYPDILKEVAEELRKKTMGLQFDRIAGIPYAAISIATAISLENDIPMIYPRKEQKGYGTKRKIEGVYSEGERILVYDDLITTGDSKFEAIAPLEAAGLIVKDIVVLVDREQGGKDDLKKKGYELHSVLTMTEIIGLLAEHNKISKKQEKEILEYIGNPDSGQKKQVAKK